MSSGLRGLLGTGCESVLQVAAALEACGATSCVATSCTAVPGLTRSRVQLAARGRGRGEPATVSGASRDSRGRLLLPRGPRLPEPPPVPRPGLGTKGFRGRGLGSGPRSPRPHRGFRACVFPPRPWPCGTGRERRTGEAAVRGSGRTSPPMTLDGCTSGGCGVAADTARPARAPAVLTAALPCGAVWCLGFSVGSHLSRDGGPRAA